MNAGEITLHLHNYALFPYERDLAGRELRALVSKRCEACERCFRVREPWDDSNFWRLTYFSHFVSGSGVRETLQHQLEQSHRKTLGRTHRRQSTRYSVHGLHEYKGKFNPQLAHALLNIFGVGEKHRVLDPFCGSGTTLIEAAHLGIAGTGFDMNPLAVLVANTKLAALSIDTSALKVGLNRVVRAMMRGGRPAPPHNARTQYLAKWFTPEILATLERLRRVILEETESSRMFFLTIASDLLRAYSLQDPSDLRIRRRQSPLPSLSLVAAWAGAARAQIDVVGDVQPVLRDRGMISRAQLADSRDWSMLRAQSDSFDFVITSPPYATALPYIDTQRLSLVWLDLVEPDGIRKLEAGVLGSREVLAGREKLEVALRENASDLPAVAVAFCRRLHRSISAGDGFRRKAVPVLLYRYLAGMKATFANLHRLLREGGKMAWVVGVNQTTLGGQRIVIDTPALLVSIAKQAGFNIDDPIELQAYQRYGVHQRNSIRQEVVLIFHK